MSTLYTDPTELIQRAAAAALKDRYQLEVEPDSLSVQLTRPDFAGDFTLVTFPLSRYRLGKPAEVAEQLGQALREREAFVVDYNVVKGFLNLSLSDTYWRELLAEQAENDLFLRRTEGAGKPVVIEYCSPNTNKPLHLGHLRNMALGYATTQILEANGYAAHPVCLYNDRGAAISMSMHAWLEEGTEPTPESTGKAGDVLVGDLYVSFSNKHRAQMKALQEQGMSEDEARTQTEAMKGVRELLLRWEAGDAEVRALWKRMNGWVYDAHRKTFASLGIIFDEFYYESDVYLEGKEIVREGLEKDVFYRKDDGSIWVDLEDAKLDQKLLLRSDGTSLYITQDLAIAEQKQRDFPGLEKSVYVVGNEQDYHFKVLFEILKRLGKPYAAGLHHLSYGMVNLTTGKMKSRLGTVVETDDLVREMRNEAEAATETLGKIAELDKRDREALYHALGTGAIKYYLLKVDPKKDITFDPKSSLGLQGDTATAIQYTYTRTQSVQREAEKAELVVVAPEEDLQATERELLRHLSRYPATLRDAAEQFSPALIANYAYDLSRLYNSFWHECRVIRPDFPGTSRQRLQLSAFTGRVLGEALRLLGIKAPERM